MIILATLCRLKSKILSIQYAKINAINEATLAKGAMLAKKQVKDTVVIK